MIETVVLGVAALVVYLALSNRGQPPTGKAPPRTTKPPTSTVRRPPGAVRRFRVTETGEIEER